MTLKRRVDFLAHLLKATLRQHHRELIPVFAPHIPDEAVVIDVGAHAGQFSKLFAKMAPRGRVYAFEPSAYARSILTRSLAFNRLNHVKVVPVGLSDAPGELILHTRCVDDPRRNGVHTDASRAELVGERSCEADQRRLRRGVGDFTAHGGVDLSRGHPDDLCARPRAPWRRSWPCQ